MSSTNNTLKPVEWIGLQTQQGTLFRTSAFSLVEVTLTLGLSAFCLIAIFALLPAGLKSNQTAFEQTAASGILSAVAADLRATRPQTQAEITGGTSIPSAQFQISIPSNPVTSDTTALPLYFTGHGNSTDQWSTDSHYRLTVKFHPNDTATSKKATLLDIKVSWPASVDPDHASGSAETFVALDRN